MRLLVQGVGQRFRREFDRPWRQDEARRGRLVVIGEKGIDQGAIAAALQALRATPCISHGSKPDRSMKPRRRSISINRRPMSSFCRSPTAISPRSPRPGRGRRKRCRACGSPISRCSSIPSPSISISRRSAPKRASCWCGCSAAWTIGATASTNSPRIARARDIQLAIVPGDRFEDARLDAASTLGVADLRLLWRYFEEGGPDNLPACLQFIAHASRVADRRRRRRIPSRRSASTRAAAGEARRRRRTRSSSSIVRSFSPPTPRRSMRWRRLWRRAAWT